MPDSRELPGVRRAVIPLVSAGDAIVYELVPHRLPRLATVVGALDLLPEPAGGLRRIQPIRVSRRCLEVIDLPAPEVGAADVPLFPLCVRRQDERALACTNQYPYSAHRLLLPGLRARLRRQHLGCLYTLYSRTDRQCVWPSGGQAPPPGDRVYARGLLGGTHLYEGSHLDRATHPQ